MRIDLHLHTTASDGRFSPEAVVHMAANRGLRFIAITDHDSIEGVAPALIAAKNFPFLTVIPGVEISTDVPHGEVHVLGYFIDYRDSELVSALKRLRDSRQKRALEMIAKLENLDIHITWERVQQLAGRGSIGRPHIAQAMLEEGYIPSIKDAFLKYIGREGPAYVEREKMTPVEAVELVLRAGGLPVLAHPANIDQLEELLSQLRGAGLVGMEVYYDGYSSGTKRLLGSLANKYKLITCGGSDFHGLESGNETPPGGVDVPLEPVEQLLNLAGKRTAGLMIP